ncbi:MAG TPA: MBL fold metallo-hydrolase [Candidatus Hydrogenedentes bacterium]|jgi:glyoxylase-like metal-dependent hydrolase (beta-lactamase superfamily II)/rhodanese-related sulfurtransferase|nr:MAG: putative metallo-hydrolase [Candidatus Hydrogenedentes bacterium ADurb.Bin101]HOC69900.1 MBL fold metallo-hydrolase [Candidatus Hydrogenedentota bacterium]HQN00030.1 MBL fold metallo-hydrolase [Candidatus Hydrogenedentota bacterium]
MYVEQFYVDGIAHLSYLVGGTTTCAIIDPSRDVEVYIQAARKMGLQITHILETHLHADFISGHMELAKSTGATLYAPKSGKCAYGHVSVKEGDSFDLEDMRFEVLDTPGHTPDCICYVVTDTSRGSEPFALFSGDTLFVGDVGRPDLFPGRGDELASSLYSNLQNKIMKLPESCLVYPAHGAGSLCGKAMGAMRVSTIGYELRHNPALQHKTEEAFKKALLSGMPEAPDHFARCSEINRRGPAVFSDLPTPQRLTPAALEKLLDTKHTLLDPRDYSAFGGAHIPGAWNIDAKHNFSTFAGWLLPPDQPIVLIPASDEQVPELTIMLRRVGLDNVVGYLAGGMNPWITGGRPIERIPTITIREVQNSCESGASRMRLLDVRAMNEYKESNIEGAVHMPVPETRTRFGELDDDVPTVLVCKSGARASTAGSILQQHGVKNLMVMAGGMVGWTSAGLTRKCATCALPHGPRTAY